MRRVLKSNDEMHRVITDFIRRLLRLEIRFPETAVATCGGAILSDTKHRSGILPAGQFLTRDYRAVEEV